MMLPKSIIKADPTEIWEKPKESKDYLNVSEFFYDTIQGEGVHTGVPSVFLRLQHCTLSCTWCDTKSVWRYGNPYTFDQLFKLIEDNGVIRRLKNGHHLVITGGSPLLQQDRLIRFLHLLRNKYFQGLFPPYIELENECVIKPTEHLIMHVNCWNNSPKLRNSGNPNDMRYNPEVIKFMNGLHSRFGTDSWFKFVVSHDSHWGEIEEDFIKPKLISRDKIILMPQGSDVRELEKNRGKVVNIAIEHGVRYCTRGHIVLWNKATGV